MSEITKSIDLQDHRTVCRAFDSAAQANLQSPIRTGSQINLPDHGRLIVSGDLHDHSINLRRIITAAQLDKSPDHHVLLQELVHSSRLISGMDLSYRMLVEVAQLQLTYPDQVHVLLANHELAQINSESVAKAGIQLVEAFDQGLDFIFADNADAVRQSMRRYIMSMSLALRCANGIMCCHSLPTEILSSKFDPSILSRVPTDNDLTPPLGDGYLMVWGRKIKQWWADQLAEIWDVDLFILGHQPADYGYELQGDTMLILASDHEQGSILPIDLSKEYTRNDLTYMIVPIASID